MTIRRRSSLLGILDTQDLRDFLVSVLPTGRAATNIVASSDASLLRQGQADHLCSGVDDDVEIQAAIDDTPSVGSGHE